MLQFYLIFSSLLLNPLVVKAVDDETGPKSMDSSKWGVLVQEVVDFDSDSEVKSEEELNEVKHR